MTTLRQRVASPGNEKTLTEQWVEEYQDDPEYIAIGMAMAVTEDVAKELQRRKLTNAWLAREMGVSQAHVSKVLGAPPNMTLLTVAKMAAALGYEPAVKLKGSRLKGLKNGRGLGKKNEARGATQGRRRRNGRA